VNLSSLVPADLSLRRWLRGALLLALAPALLLCGCANDDATLGVDLLGPTPGTMVSLQHDVQPIFTASCAVSGCHDAGILSAGMVLEEGRLFDPVEGIVGVPSQEALGVLRVKPGSSAESYLIHKLQGTQDTVGGGGDPMPFGGPSLADSTLQVIRDWIDQGALDN
jgi:hypothetical protein